ELQVRLIGGRAGLPALPQYPNSPSSDSLNARITKTSKGDVFANYGPFIRRFPSASHPHDRAHKFGSSAFTFSIAPRRARKLHGTLDYSVRVLQTRHTPQAPFVSPP